jgi:hypothetical protein
LCPLQASDSRIVAETRGFSPKASREFNETQYYTVIAAPSKDATCGLYDPTAHHFLTTTLNGTALDGWSYLFAWYIPRHRRDGAIDQSPDYAIHQCSANASSTHISSPPDEGFYFCPV